MGNLKHTVVSIIAIVMISSMAATQATQLTTVRANGINAEPAGKQTVTVENQPKATATIWHEDIADDFIKDIKAEAEPEETVLFGYVIVQEGALNVRPAASTESEVVDQLFCGEKVTILAEEGDWYQISYGLENKIGYVVKESITTSYEQARDLAVQTSMYEVGSAVVGEGALNIRAEANTESAVIDQIDNGDQVIVIAKEGEWLKVYYGRDYKVGYVIAASINLNGMISKEEVANKKNERVAQSAIGKGVVSISSGAVNVRESADENAAVKTQLDNSTNVLVLSRENGWTKIAYGSSNTVGYVKSEYIVDPSINVSRSSETRQTQPAEKATQTKTDSAKTSASKSTAKEKTKEPAPAKASVGSSSKGQALVNEAEKYIGTKYVYGGSSPSGFDCSGLVQYVCRKQGISVGRSSRDQFNNGVAVSRSELQPGDLVFFKRNGTISHVGIYAGNGQMIHSPQTGKTVTYTSIESTSRQSSYAGARRVTN